MLHTTGRRPGNYRATTTVFLSYTGKLQQPIYILYACKNFVHRGLAASTTTRFGGSLLSQIKLWNQLIVRYGRHNKIYFPKYLPYFQYDWQTYRNVTTGFSFHDHFISLLTYLSVDIKIYNVINTIQCI